MSQANQIAFVRKGSVAAENGIEPLDIIESINNVKLEDIFDYYYYEDEPEFDMVILKPDGDRCNLHIVKGEGEDLGISFENGLMDEYRSCHNKCIFCFIDQMPPGMRNTLYVKDDDWRLSLMMGNYITMTNISDQEFDRIIRRRVSPLYISVHATDPEVRVAMMRNPRAAQVMDRLHQLQSAGLRFHCQVVLCPGWNDGEVLKKTVADLKALWPFAQSVALVPIGLTRFREGLPYIAPYNRESAAELIRSAMVWQKECLNSIGTRFVYPADEFYCLSGFPLPDDEEYEDFPQIENGVGMLRMFETDLAFAAEDSPVESTKERHLVIACGTSIAENMQLWCNRYQPRGTHVKVKAIINHFFGETVTVTGLITGTDLVEQLQDESCDEILICRNMIRNEGDLFLDDMSVEDVRAKLPAPLRIVENTGEAFWRAISGLDEIIEPNSEE